MKLKGKNLSNAIFYTNNPTCLPPYSFFDSLITLLPTYHLLSLSRSHLPAGHCSFLVAISEAFPIFCMVRHTRQSQIKRRKMTDTPQ